ncbi:Uu.00g129880.m01.CDS01 [Anthostomella pinea]|uniref:Uu.00g129880.m01.CDS01 n=1 Tax=Anthostomella pinea TaxID=933095 RepID=A0AAI8YI39_9PEZI|nr:Uu.00g129880.m01.CDS01 [Anthostomella pinea]
MDPGIMDAHLDGHPLDGQLSELWRWYEASEPGLDLGGPYHAVMYLNSFERELRSLLEKADSFIEEGAPSNEAKIVN